MNTDALATLAASRSVTYTFLAAQALAPPGEDEPDRSTLAAAWRELADAFDVVDAEPPLDASLIGAEFAEHLGIANPRYLAPFASAHWGAAQRVASDHRPELPEGVAAESGAPEPAQTLRPVKSGPSGRARHRLGRLRGAPYFEAKAHYQNAGYQTSNDGVEADHLGSELHFLAALCQNEAAAWRSGEHERAQESRTAQASFLESHLMVWYPGLQWRAKEVGVGPYCSRMFEVIGRLLEAEAEHLEVGERAT